MCVKFSDCGCDSVAAIASEQCWCMGVYRNMPKKKTKNCD